jgi:hypothetical protein
MSEFECCIEARACFLVCGRADFVWFFGRSVCEGLTGSRKVGRFH